MILLIPIHLLIDNLVQIQTVLLIHMHKKYLQTVSYTALMIGHYGMYTMP